MGTGRAEIQDDDIGEVLMKRAKRIKYMVICLSAVLIFGILICHKINRVLLEQNLFLVLEEKEEVISSKLIIQIGDEKNQINAFENKNGELYFFLPAGISYNNIKLLNYTKEEYEKTSVGLGELCIREKGGEEKKVFHFLQGSYVPTIFIDIDCSAMEMCEDKNRKTSGCISAYNKDGEKMLEQSIEFGGHGNSSFVKNDKKSWNIEFDHEISLFGLAKGKEYVALANAQDVSYMRNKIAFDMAEKVGFFYTPQGEYANLYINGEYMGLYLIAEKIEASQERVALEIQDLSGVYSDENLIRYDTYKEKGYVFPETADIYENSSYLFKEDTEDDGRYDTIKNGFVANEESMFEVISPQYVSQQQISDLRLFVEALLNGIKAEDGYCKNTLGDAVHYSEIIDMDSFIKKYLIEEITKNYDGNIRSSYYYINSFDENIKVFAGPVWDYDLAFGNCQNSVQWNNPQGIVKYRPGLDLRDEFKTMAIQYYAAYFSPYLDKEIEINIYKYKEEIRESVEMDQIRWSGNPMWIETFDEGVESLINFIKVRKQFLDDVWLKGKVYHRVNFVDEDKVIKSVYVEDGGFLEKYIPQKDGKTFVGWYDEDMENEIDYTSEITDNTAFWAKWE